MKTFVIGDIHGRRPQLQSLLAMLPRDAESDTLVFLGDLIDRGTDAPGVVSDVLELQRQSPERVVCLRGNHEQMLLDCMEEGALLWFSPATGGERTFEQYTGHALQLENETDFEAARREIQRRIPAAHLEFFNRMPFFYEDDFAIYVHAGLDHGRHPRDTSEHFLLWARDKDFYTNYTGKPCVFGHTPTPFLPLRGRLGRHGIYVFHSAIGIDTGFTYNSPLTCLELPDFNLYQAFADGHTNTHHITTLIPEPIRAMRKTTGAL
ncbi:MAG TPA: metallophosphoesterase family protein [Pyrinomonadaceae bacterium]|jgi:serine/threonine protein phosphatase 1|nr:metallophosphoesterase family protein [Pyrinomonadaceae bacterium]